jgi:hypothetical protein
MGLPQVFGSGGDRYWWVWIVSWRELLSVAKPIAFRGIGDLTPWLNQSARRNRWAAGFAGAPVLFAGIATLCGIP